MYSVTVHLMPMILKEYDTILRIVDDDDTNLPQEGVRYPRRERCANNNILRCVVV
jgi:hypothetical protein